MSEYPATADLVAAFSTLDASEVLGVLRHIAESHHRSAQVAVRLGFEAQAAGPMAIFGVLNAAADRLEAVTGTTTSCEGWPTVEAVLGRLVEDLGQ